MPKELKKVLVFVIDEYGRTLDKKSLHKLISEFCENVLDGQNVDIVVVHGHTINTCAYLLGQITGRGIADWEIIYLHAGKYPPVLLAHEDKEKLIVLLPGFNGTSAEAVYKVLLDSGAYDSFK